MSFMSSRTRRAFAASTVGLFLATLAPAALADPESDAKDVFARARELRAANNCADAAPLFRKAWQTYPQGLGSLRNLAECEEQLNHYAASRRAWLDLKRALITAPNDPKYDGWDKDADDAANRLKPKVASFVIDVLVKDPQGETPATEKTGVQLTVNGEPVASALIGAPLERDPGTYTVHAELKNALQPAEQSVTLKAGDNPHVVMHLEVPAATQPIDLSGPPPDTADHGAGRRTAGWVVVGVGAGALVASAITFGIRQGASGDVDDACPTHHNCSPSLKDTVDRGKAMSTATSILFPVGLVGVAAGLVLVFTAPKAHPAPTTGFTIRPTADGFAGTF